MRRRSICDPGEDEDTMIISDYSTEPHWSVAPGENVGTDIERSWNRNDWQRMWLRTQSQDWRTLALVPGDSQTSTFRVANLIARLGLDHGESIQVADTRELRLKYVDAYLEGARWEAAHGDRIIFATRSAAINLATVRIASAADCAILCVTVGSTSLDAVRDTIEQIGRKHFLGSLLVRASTESDSPNDAISTWRSAPKARP
jgi:hypothetical protein